MQDDPGLSTETQKRRTALENLNMRKLCIELIACRIAAYDIDVRASTCPTSCLENDSNLKFDSGLLQMSCFLCLAGQKPH